jgi:spermidine synthase
MRMAKPQVVEIDYVQRMLASLLWLPSVHWAGQAVQLGLGAGAITRFTAVQLKMATTVVEINPQVVAVNAAYFHLPARGRGGAGRRGRLAGPGRAASVRLLHVDLYDHEAAAPVLDDVDFYRACRAVLEEGGLMSVNLFGRHASFHDSIARIAAALAATRCGACAPRAKATPWWWPAAAWWCRA